LCTCHYNIIKPTANKTLNPNRLSTSTLPTALVSLKGALFVSSGFGAEVLLCVCVPLEVVLSAAMVVVIVVLLDTLSPDAVPEGELEEDKGLCVVVNVEI